MNKKQFLEYIGHFNNKRYDALASYFTPDMTAEYGIMGMGSKTPNRILHGPQEFVEFYKSLHQYVREVLELGDFIVNKDFLFAELWTEFHCFKDVPASFGQPWKKGDVFVGTFWVLYNLEGDKMKRIRITHFKTHNPKQAKF